MNSKRVVASALCAMGAKLATEADWKSLGVEPADALTYIGKWLAYLPECEWPASLGARSDAGASHQVRLNASRPDSVAETGRAYRALRRASDTTTPEGDGRNGCTHRRRPLLHPLAAGHDSGPIATLHQQHGVPWEPEPRGVIYGELIAAAIADAPWVKHAGGATTVRDVASFPLVTIGGPSPSPRPTTDGRLRPAARRLNSRPRSW